MPNSGFLVFGCGYVGSVLAEKLHAGGHPVTGITASEASANKLSQTAGYPVQACDIADDQMVAGLARRLEEAGASPSAVIHCASSGRSGIEAYERVYLQGIRNIAESFAESHLVFTSSSSVYPQTDGSEVNEESETEPERRTAQVLLEAEEVALASGGSVVRLSGIYGPDRWYLVRGVVQGTAKIEVAEGAPDGRYINCIHREDAARALEFVSKGKLGGIFNATDDTPITQREVYEALSRRLNLPMPENAVPDLSRKRAWTHKRVSNKKLRASGWTPKYPSMLERLIYDDSVFAAC